MQLAEQRSSNNIRRSHKSVLQTARRWKYRLYDIDSDTDEEMIATDDEPMAAYNTNELS